MDVPIPPIEVDIVVNNKSTPLMFNWMQTVTGLLQGGITGTVTLAKLTGGGANGSLTFVNGILTSKVDPT